MDDISINLGTKAANISEKEYNRIDNKFNPIDLKKKTKYTKIMDNSTNSRELSRKEKFLL